MADKRIFSKILFLTDGSSPSLAAQEVVILLAKKLRSDVTAFHVVTHELMRPLVKDFLVRSRGIPEAADIKPAAIVTSDISLSRMRPTAPGAHYSERIEDELTEIYLQQGEHIVADAAQAMKEEGIKAEQQVVRRKNIAEAVMKEAERESHELIVMGRSGDKDKGTHLGSVAEKVVRRSDVPVLVVGDKRDVSKILVSLDGSESSERALEHAAALAKRLGASMTLMHVQESHLFGLRPELMGAIGKGILAEAAGKLKGMVHTERLESGDPASTITSVAEKGGFDLIVMGNRGHGSVSRFFLGSVSSHVLHYTNRSVLVVK